MEEKIWSLGEPCFIVEKSVSDLHASIRVMPAIVTHLSHGGRSATATAYSPQGLGKQFIEGIPFASESEARQSLQAYAKRIAEAAASAPLFGIAPGWDIPAHPKCGDTVYILDAERSEVLEVTVGIVQLECGQLQVAYDECPGNGEANNVLIKTWWDTADRAQWGARNQYYREFTVVAKEEVARRANARVEEIWKRAEANIRSPSFQEKLFDGMTRFIEELKRRTSRAAG